jgi:elongation factor Tu
MLEKKNENENHLNLGTIGHVDHGKTTLTAALWSRFGKNKKDISDVDNHAEEKKRGITINTRTVQYFTKKSEVSHVDCPGHADFIKNMITGAAKLDAALLVVSAFDGPQAQTKEHIKIAIIVGIKHYIVILNKIDMISEADMEIVSLVEDEIIDLLTATKEVLRENIKFVKISATTALKEVQEGKTPTEYGIMALDKIGEEIDNIPPIDFTSKNSLPFRMTVEDTYSITGRGTVAAGKVEAGTLKNGEVLELIGKNKTIQVTVTSMECFNQQRQEVSTGDNAALLIKVDRADVDRGAILCKKGSVNPVHYAKVQLYLFTPEEGGRKSAVGVGYIPHTFVGPRDTPSEILQSDKELIEPGDTSICFIACLKSMPFVANESKMIFRESNSTIGVAIVLESFDKCPVDVKGRKSSILDTINTKVKK